VRLFDTPGSEPCAICLRWLNSRPRTSGYPAHSVFSRQFTRRCPDRRRNPLFALCVGCASAPVAGIPSSSASEPRIRRESWWFSMRRAIKTDPTIRRRYAALPKGHAGTASSRSSKAAAFHHHLAEKKMAPNAIGIRGQKLLLDFN